MGSTLRACKEWNGYEKVTYTASGELQRNRFFSVFRNISTSLKSVFSGILPARHTRKHPSLPHLCMTVITGMEWWERVCVLEANFQGLKHNCACLLAVCNFRQFSNQDIVIFISYLLWVVNQIIYANLLSTVRWTRKGFKRYHHHRHHDLPNAICLISLSCVLIQLTFYLIYFKCDNIMLSGKGYGPFNRGNLEKSN